MELKVSFYKQSGKWYEDFTLVNDEQIYLFDNRLIELINNKIRNHRYPCLKYGYLVLDNADDESNEFYKKVFQLDYEGRVPYYG